MALAQDSARAVRLPRKKRREQLLNAAQDLFVSEGYHAAAMDAIAERAGVSKPVLYQHFPSKLELYLALLDRSSDALVRAVAEALGSTRVNRVRVDATVRAYFEFVDHEAGAFRLIFESDVVNEPPVRERVDATNDKCAGLVAAVIAEDTGLDDESAMILASGLIGAAHTSARRWLRKDRTTPMEDAAGILSNLVWRGISGFPRTDESLPHHATATNRDKKA